jgi:hypothetical protein
LFLFICRLTLRSAPIQRPFSTKETKMRNIGTISLVAVSALALAAGVTRASAPVAGDTIQLVHEMEPGDDRGGHGRGSDDAVVTTHELELGDDKGGLTEAEPGDDKGGDNQHGGHGSDD